MAGSRRPGEASDLVVLDVDVKNGAPGAATLKHSSASTASYRRRQWPTPFRVACTHWFKWPKGRKIRNDAGRKLGPGSISAPHGGQVVAPPTVRPGGSYRWHDGRAVWTSTRRICRRGWSTSSLRSRRSRRRIWPRSTACSPIGCRCRVTGTTGHIHGLTCSRAGHRRTSTERCRTWCRLGGPPRGHIGNGQLQGSRPPLRLHDVDSVASRPTGLTTNTGSSCAVIRRADRLAGGGARVRARQRRTLAERKVDRATGEVRAVSHLTYRPAGWRGTRETRVELEPLAPPVVGAQLGCRSAGQRQTTFATWVVAQRTTGRPFPGDTRSGSLATAPSSASRSRPNA